MISAIAAAEISDLAPLVVHGALRIQNQRRRGNAGNGQQQLGIGVTDHLVLVEVGLELHAIGPGLPETSIKILQGINHNILAVLKGKRVVLLAKRLERVLGNFEVGLESVGFLGKEGIGH